MDKPTHLRDDAADLPGGAHGGNVADWVARTGRPRDQWIDLSTGINPIPYRLGDDLTGGDTWQTLPDTAALDGLIRAAADYYHAPSEWVTMVPGTQLLIQLLPQILQGASRPVAIISPTYGEHERVWRGTGAEIETPTTLPEPGNRVAVVVNPNNPDGRVIPPDVLVAWAKDADAQGGTLIVDEAFGDLMPEASVVPLMEEARIPNIAVLKSFGKFFGLAGLRLGALIALPERADRMAGLLGPWAVSTPAIEVGRRAYSDDAWIAGTRRRLARDRERLARLFELSGLQVTGGTDLFLHLEHAHAADLFAHLVDAGILLRRFAGRETVLRSGLPGPEAAWQRLEDALAAWRGGPG